jgi:hypothetical protein
MKDRDIRNIIGKEMGYMLQKHVSMNNLKQVKEKHVSVLAPLFPDMDIAQFKACVTCIETLDRNQVPNLLSSTGFMYPP